jgi:ribulose-phosphate 3-epimerase
MPAIIISSSILSADFSRLADQIHQAADGGVDWIHVDVMDGSFVPNITMGPFIVETCRRITSLPIDVHLMIEHPERHLAAFAQAGASQLSVHIENTPHIFRILEEIHELGCKAGIVLNPGTPVDRIESVISLVDLVLVMTVNPGFSGQKFLPESVNKVAQVRQLLADRGSQAVIQVDGGINPETLPSVVKAGARAIVAATSIFKAPAGISAGIRELRQAVA